MSTGMTHLFAHESSVDAQRLKEGRADFRSKLISSALFSVVASPIGDDIMHASYTLTPGKGISNLNVFYQRRDRLPLPVCTDYALA